MQHILVQPTCNKAFDSSTTMIASHSDRLRPASHRAASVFFFPSLIVVLFGVILLCSLIPLPHTPIIQALAHSTSTHTNNWAVIVSTSRYWFNYRHSANALSFYRSVKRLGIPDSQILLFLADDHACNARNMFRPSIFSESSHDIDLYPRDIEVDYRGTDVNVQSFLRLLTGRHPSEATPRSKRLLTDESSNILIYMSGHGGNNFLKFQDNEELNAQDVRDAIQQMHAARRYRSILFILDTCQAATLFYQLTPDTTPNVITLASSKLDENSYSYLSDALIGVSLADRFTYWTLEWFRRSGVVEQQTVAKEQEATSHASALSNRKSLKEMIESYTYSFLSSHVEWRSDLLRSDQIPLGHTNDPLSGLRIMDYFGAITPVRPGGKPYPIEPSTRANPALSSEERTSSEQDDNTGSMEKHRDAASQIQGESLFIQSNGRHFSFSTDGHFFLVAAGLCVLLGLSLILDVGSSPVQQTRPSASSVAGWQVMRHPQSIIRM